MVVPTDGIPIFHKVNKINYILTFIFFLTYTNIEKRDTDKIRKQNTSDSYPEFEDNFSLSHYENR